MTKIRRFAVDGVVTAFRNHVSKDSFQESKRLGGFVNVTRQLLCARNQSDRLCGAPKNGPEPSGVGAV